MRPCLRSGRRPRGRRRLGLLSVAIVCGAGCGTSRPPVLTNDVSDDGGDGANGTDGGAVVLNVDSGPPTCDANLPGNVCGCEDLDLLSDPPNLYFLLDRSGSMNDGGKWLTIRTVIADVMRDLGPRARFGAALFPDPNADACSTGIQVMPLMSGDTPAGTYGPATAAFTFDTNYPASGGTPTAATVTALTPTLVAFPGKTFVILATDGGPNCDPNAACGPSACIPNIEADPGCSLDGGGNCCAADAGGAIDCLDSGATVAAVAALAAAGIPTYVVGVPGSGPYLGILNQMALAGGTARPTSPYYYPVDTTDTADFTATLSKVAAKITASCAFTLAAPPADPTLVNVYLDDVVVPQDPANGWTLSGATVTLEGTTCAHVLAGTSLDLRIVSGCPTVVP